MEGLEPPPDIASLAERVKELGAGIESSRAELQQLMTPGYDGLWVTTDGRSWSFRARRRKRAA